MLKNLIKIAAELDNAGFRMESDIVDVIIRRVASEMGSDPQDLSGESGLNIPSDTMDEGDIKSLLSSFEGYPEEEDEGEYEDWEGFDQSEEEEEEDPDQLDIDEFLARY